MADIKKIKDKITSTIYPNGKGAINAADHQAMLLEMADNIIDNRTQLTELSQEVEGLKNAGSGGVTDEQIEDAIGLMIPHDCNNDFNTDFAI